MECSYGSETDVYADFNMNGTKVALFIRKGMAETVNKANLPEHAEMQDRVALVFKVDSVDATYDSLRLKGIEFVNTPTDRPDWGIRTAHFRDPDGNLLEIYTDLGND
jgi:catechol 2,3-dioxygenase-like lactoylglutathione lyase family enzyme